MNPSTALCVLFLVSTKEVRRNLQAALLNGALNTPTAPLLRGKAPTPNGATCLPCVATRGVWERDPGG